jgi:hypothetical protein
MAKCWYCGRDAYLVAVCNDWGNVPLCDDGKCFDEFKEEYQGQFFTMQIMKK